MTGNLVDVQKSNYRQPKVMLLSHTVFPEVDNVATLKAAAIEKE
jgi:protein SCO1/2